MTYTWKLQEQAVSDADCDALCDFIRYTPRFTQFTEVAAFEREFAAWQGARCAVFVNSGSAANLLLIAVLKESYGWQAGDEVIVPAVTWPTTVTPIMQLGLTPVFCDVTLTDLGLDAERVAAAITPKTRAVFAVHLLGFPMSIDSLILTIEGRDITLIEDCCEAQGATHPNGAKVGSLYTTAGTFSFYWGHHMTTVEGGLIVTDDDDLYRLLLLKRSHGLARELPECDHEALRFQHADLDFRFLFLTDGYNCRNTELAAVLGRAQLRRVDDFIRIRRENYARFLSLCRGYPDRLLTVDVPGASPLVLPFIFRRAPDRWQWQDVLTNAGIESRPIVAGNLTLQPFLRGYYERGKFPNADLLHHNGLYIGNSQFVGAERLDLLAGLMRSCWGEASMTVELYHGDCLDFLKTLPAGSVDAVVTDPPYGVEIGVNNNQQRDGSHLAKQAYESYKDSYENFVNLILPRLKLALSIATRGAVFTGPHIWEQHKATAMGGIYCPSAIGRTPWGSKNLLPILFYGNPPRPGRHRPTILYSTAISEQNGHPCPKPLEWMRWLIELASDPGATILDPFMGSGTTGVACVQTGRNFIGCELDAGYFAIAERRIARAEMQPRLMTTDAPRYEQAEMSTC